MINLLELIKHYESALNENNINRETILIQLYEIFNYEQHSTFLNFKDEYKELFLEFLKKHIEEGINGEIEKFDDIRKTKYFKEKFLKKERKEKIKKIL